MIYHLTRATRHLFFWSLIALAIALSAMRFLLASIEVYKEDLESRLSAELAAPVKISSLGAGIHAFRPALVLKNIQVMSAEAAATPVIRIKEVRVSLDLLRALGDSAALASARVTLIGAELSVKRYRDGHIAILGVQSTNDQPPFWLLQGERYEFLQSRVLWQDEMVDANAHQSLAHLDQLFQDVNVLLQNSVDGKHVINMMLKLPARYGESLIASMQLRGNFLAANGLNGLIYVKGKRLNLASIPADLLPLGLKLNRGHLDAQLWSYWQNSALQAMTGNTQVQDLALQRANHADLLLTNFSWRFNALHVENGWQMKADHVMLHGEQLQLLDAGLALAFNEQPTLALSGFTLKAQQLDLQQFVRASEFWRDPHTSTFTLPAVRGQLKNFYLRYVFAPQKYTLQGDLEQFNLTAAGDMPGITNLQAHFAGDQQHGNIDLHLLNSALDLPTVFPQALELSKLNTQLQWQQTRQGWSFTAPQIVLDVPDIQGRGRLALSVDKESLATAIDLYSTFTGDSDVHSFARYFPTQLLGPDTTDWLRHAFVRGRGRFKEIILKGNLADFPFAQNQGIFKIALVLDGLELNYTPDWGHLSNLTADTTFYQAGMKILAQGNAQKAKLEQFVIEIPSFSSSEYLDITGQGHGPLAEILAYLKQSPVSSKIDDLLEVINLQGNAHFDLHLQIPLVDKLPQKLAGTAYIEPTKLDVLALDLPVTGVTGTLHFSDQGVTDGEFQGRALGDALQGVLQNNAERMQIALNGHTTMLDLQKFFKVPEWEVIDGDTDYQVQIDLPYAKNALGTLEMSSDLTGVQVQLPAALAKTPSEQKLFKLSMNLGDSAVLQPLHVNYAEQLRALLMLNTKQKRLESTYVIVGAGDLPTPPFAGSHLQVNLAELNLADWLGYAGVDAGKNRKPLFEQISIQGKHLLAQKKDLGAVAVNLQHKEQAWQVDVDSTLLKGKIQIPQHPERDDPLQLTLDFVNLSGLSSAQEQQAAAAPRVAKAQKLPLFNLDSQQVLWHGVDLGRLAVSTSRMSDGIHFNQVTLKQDQGEWALTGDWHTETLLPKTSVAGKLTMQAFGEYLARLDLTHDLKATQATINFNLNWQGAPQDFALQRLDGNVDLQLSNGRILSIEPGFGRVLGFLAMEQWERRLRLDFSDLYAQGLMFNSIRGNFNLRQGNASTERLVVDAIPAEIIIKGSTYLEARTLNHHLTVLPKSSAAVPIAGTIVDKVLTFAAETVTGNSQEGFLLGSEFQVSGSWQNPEVTPLYENDGLLQKTWHGLTDFSVLH